MLSMELLAKDMATLADNLEITEEKVRHFLSAQSTHAVHLLVLGKVVAELLRQHPTDLSFVREELAELPQREVSAVAISVLEAIEADANRA